MKLFKNIHFFKTIRIICLLSGIISISALLIAFTTLPFWGVYWLATSKSELSHKPEYIILLGGGGMPSESNLIRAWYTAIAAEKFPDAKIIVAVPGEDSKESGTPYKLKNELELRGVESSRIIFELKGRNTHSQAFHCMKFTGNEKPVLLISSPEHIRRAVLTFKKSGYELINAIPAFEVSLEADLKFKDESLPNEDSLIPDVRKSIQFRYQIWNHLKYEITFTREIVALFYYRLKGWI